MIDNNAHPDTQGEVEETSARVVVETIQGYGAAIQRGVAETVDADLVCICEPDGTFDPDDILKLLPFTADVDVVFGSRTVRIFILSGANMGLFLKWGNWAVAKLTELLFNTVYLSDVGCTYRVLTRDAVDRLRPGFRDDGVGVRLRDDAADRRTAPPDGAGTREVSAAGGRELGHRRPDPGLLAGPRDDPHVRTAPHPRSIATAPLRPQALPRREVVAGLEAHASGLLLVGDGCQVVDAHVCE